LEEAVSAVFAVLEHTEAAGTEEMTIVEAAASLARPVRRFEAVAVGANEDDPS
jgi:pyridoxal/pyridoxine/pyridoxamine kinase